MPTGVKDGRDLEDTLHADDNDPTRVSPFNCRVSEYASAVLDPVTGNRLRHNPNPVPFVGWL